MIKISVVIPTYNRKDSILRVLESIGKQDIGGMDLSIIVVVDGSTDGTQESIREFYPDVTMIEGNGNWWWTKSVNEGCKLALKNKGDAALLLNDDVRLDEHYFQELLKAHTKEPHAIIGSLNITLENGKRIFFSGAKRIRWWDGKLERYHPFLSPYDKNLTGLFETVTLPGRGLLIPIPGFETVGYFDEKGLPQYKADYDFVLRAKKRGIPCMISWDSIIYVQMETTGKGATFINGSIFSFMKSLFQKHSRTNIYRNFIYYRRHYPTWGLLLFPITAMMILIRQVYHFLRVKNNGVKNVF